MKKFWKWLNRETTNKETGEAETERVLIINGEIASESWFGDEVTPAEFKKELHSGNGDIVVWINSPGGDCLAASLIYTMLMEYKGQVTVKIDGLAASAASVIAMAGTKVCMSPTSMMMIHNPMTLAMGNKEEMKKAIEMLDAVKESIINAYELKTGLRRNKISEMMTNETWMDAKKAMELKFCDEMLTRAEQDSIEQHLEPQMFEKKTMEANLRNKLEEKYLIKKPVDEPVGTPAKDLLDRLDLIKNFI